MSGPKIIQGLVSRQTKTFHLIHYLIYLTFGKTFFCNDAICASSISLRILQRGRKRESKDTVEEVAIQRLRSFVMFLQAYSVLIWQPPIKSRPVVRLISVQDAARSVAVSCQDFPPFINPCSIPLSTSPDYARRELIDSSNTNEQSFRCSSPHVPH